MTLEAFRHRAAERQTGQTTMQHDDRPTWDSLYSTETTTEKYARQTRTAAVFIAVCEAYASKAVPLQQPACASRHHPARAPSHRRRPDRPHQRRRPEHPHAMMPPWDQTMELAMTTEAPRPLATSAALSAKIMNAKASSAGFIAVGGLVLLSVLNGNSWQQNQGLTRREG